MSVFMIDSCIVTNRAEIQQKCYEATRWTPQYDSYGRTYYLHSDTGTPTRINTIDIYIHVISISLPPLPPPDSSVSALCFWLI